MKTPATLFLGAGAVSFGVVLPLPGQKQSPAAKKKEGKQSEAEKQRRDRNGYAGNGGHRARRRGAGACCDGGGADQDEQTLCPLFRRVKLFTRCFSALARFN
jgi:hypothetical protein